MNEEKSNERTRKARREEEAEDGKCFGRDR